MFGVYTLDEPADGVVRAPKLNCKKSRFGCTRCKLRRVKVCPELPLLACLPETSANSTGHVEQRSAAAH